LATLCLLVFNNPSSPDQAAADLGDDYFEDFEGSVFPAWTATGLWHIEDNDTSLWPISGIPSDSHYAWYGNSISGNYNTTDRNFGNLTSDSIDLTGLSESIEIGFWSWAQTENSEEFDKKMIFISPDGGASWEKLGLIPNLEGWQYWTFDITDFKYSNDFCISFSFDTVDDIENYYRGWLIDDISIGKPLERFDLWIEQETHALIYDSRVMDFNAKSYYDYGMTVNVTIIIETPNGTFETLYIKDDIGINAYELWVISIDYTFEEAGDYYVYFVLVDDTGKEWVVECWWGVEEDVFDLWIGQDNQAFLYEERAMQFSAISYFNHSKYVNISINIETPSSGYEYLFYKENIGITAYGSWDYSLSYTFTQIGYYYVEFNLIDETGMEWYIDCEWEIQGEKNDTFILWIEQDNYAGITDARKMGFYAESYFDNPMTVSIKIEIKLPNGTVETLYMKDMILIEAYKSWNEWLDYKFMQAGDYIVIFTLIDETGKNWVVDCWWYVEADFYELWINQDYHAGVTDIKPMEFQVNSYFHSQTKTNITINIVTPSEVITPLYYEENVEIEAYGDWYHVLEYEFNETGEFLIQFIVEDDSGKEWVENCWWWVEEDFFDTWIEQEREAYVNDIGWMNFHTKSYFNVSMNVDIIIEIETPNYVVETLYEGSIWIDAYESWNYSLKYEFTEEGEYGVYFTIIDEFETKWYIDCWWKVIADEPEEKEYFDLDIEQVNRAEVGAEEKMEFFVKSYFNHGMAVNISITIETPNGIFETLYEDNFVWIEAFGSWSHSLEYKFTEEGDYEVLFILIDDKGVEWSEDCDWEITEPEETSETSDSEPSIGVTSGFESLLIIAAIATMTILYRRHQIRSD